MIREGYQQTAIGLIPCDWEVKKVGDLVNFSGGSQPPRSCFYFSPKQGYIRLIQIRDYKTDEYASYIPEHLANKKCLKDDIMIGRYGPPIFQILRGLEGAYNVAIIKAIPCESLDKEYLYYFLNQESLFKFIEALSQRSSGQTGVDMEQLKAYPFPFPTLPEQKAIAEALGDVDRLINACDRLIVKKRDIKQGAMQELLTGRSRLPGFSGEWEVKKLGEVGDFFSGGTPLTSNISYYGGDISWITSSDLNKSKILSVSGRITQEGLKNSSAKMINKNTLLIALYGATAGVTAISYLNAAINQAVLAIIPFQEDSQFLYYKLSSKKSWIINTYTQGGQPNLSGNIIKSIEFPLPPLEEQKAIAQILSDMDSEIEALEKKRDKYKLVKQGMMQELLTGKTRILRMKG
jgi:type I restriction enzyme S subunit